MRTVSLLAVLATAATLPLAAQQRDTTRSGAASGHMMGGAGAGTTHGAMMGSGMTGSGMMGGGMMGGGMMAGWMTYGMGMDSTMAGSMMRNMAFMPQHLLAERESLKLTPAQVTRLESIEQAMQSAHQAMWQQAQPHMRAMTSLMGGSSPDSASLKSNFEAASAAMTAAHWAVVNAAVQARAVLTEAQRREVEASSAAWASGSMMGGRGMGAHQH
jgi:Spy/CpxP family protein refolding chaperone